MKRLKNIENVLMSQKSILMQHMVYGQAYPICIFRMKKIMLVSLLGNG
jgi:hypothetical protein